MDSDFIEQAPQGQPSSLQFQGKRLSSVVVQPRESQRQGCCGSTPIRSGPWDVWSSAATADGLDQLRNSNARPDICGPSWVNAV